MEEESAITDDEGMPMEGCSIRDYSIEGERSSMCSTDREVKAIIDTRESSEEKEEKAPLAPKPPQIWPDVDEEEANRHRQEVERIRENFDDVAALDDPAMASEYAEEIFEYMSELEVG